MQKPIVEAFNQLLDRPGLIAGWREGTIEGKGLSLDRVFLLILSKFLIHLASMLHQKQPLIPDKPFVSLYSPALTVIK